MIDLHASGLVTAGDDVRPVLAVCDAIIPAPLLLASVTHVAHGASSSVAPLLAVEMLCGGTVTVQQQTTGRCAMQCALF